MTSPELENLVRIGKLKREGAVQSEIDGLVRSGVVRLDDAKNTKLNLESRFDLGYNAAHAFALAALRRIGYRSDNRYVVFQAIPHTLGLGPDVWRILAKAHEMRNAGEYEGALQLDKRIVSDLIKAADVVRSTIETLDPISEKD